MSGEAGLANSGVVYFNRPPVGAGIPGVRAARTVIVTGLALSGTSMVAQAVKAAGVFIGAAADDVVHEDAEIGAALARRDEAALGAIIANRNAGHDVWAFKRPNLHEEMAAEAVARFRNPLLVVTLRDLAAITRRAVLSEQVAEWAALEAAAASQVRLLAFLRRLRCPIMLVSYEKAVAAPDEFVAALGDFIGAAAGAAAVEPGRAAFIRARRRRFEGVIDYVADGVLSGWAWEVGSAAPVRLELLLDDAVVAEFAAEQLRPDLAAAGYGGGRHGFAVNVRRFLQRPEAVVRVRVAGRTFELGKSGSRLKQLVRA